MLKWPNDLLCEGGKLAGILLERAGDRIVVGFGVNLAVAPEVEGRTCAALDGTTIPQAFAPLLAGAFDRMVHLWRNSDPAAFARAWMARAHPLGQKLSVHSGEGEKVEGLFDGIEKDGALRLRVGERTAIFHAGDVALG